MREVLRRAFRNARRCFELWRALTFGDYVHSIGGPEEFDDGHIYKWRGSRFKFCTPVQVKEVADA